MAAGACTVSIACFQLFANDRSWQATCCCGPTAQRFHQLSAGAAWRRTATKEAEMRSTRAVAVAVGLALLLALPALGQGLPTGKLSGKVSFENQPLAGVTVTVSSPSLQGTRTATTSANGDYLFAALPPGNYTVSFEAQGMQTVEDDLLISTSQSVVLDAEMVAGEIVTEEITVTEDSGALESISESTQNATTYTKTLVDNLPAGRTITQIVAMAPGVQPNGPSKDSSTGLSNITVSGAPTFENLFTINGV